MTVHLKRLAVLAVLLPLGACATKRDLRDLQVELRAHTARQDSANRAITRLLRATQDSLFLYSDQVFNFRGDMANRLGVIEDQLVRLGELTGQSQRSLAALRDQIQTQRAPAPVRQDPRPVGGTVGEEAGDGDPTPQTIAGVAEEPEAVFNLAMAQFNRGSYRVANFAFRRFLEEYPDHALAPKAHLRLAELLATENSLDDAAREYLKVRELFPTSEEVPEALFKAGALYLEMENFDLARQYLEQVVNTYPDGPFAQMAQDRLSDIP